MFRQKHVQITEHSEKNRYEKEENRQRSLSAKVSQRLKKEQGFNFYLLYFLCFYGAIIYIDSIIFMYVCLHEQDLNR